MCGIVGYVGKRKAEEVLLQGLRRLEYRGYDSAGIATVEDGAIRLTKAVGKVVVLSDALARDPHAGSVGIAHTRWATHGVPSDINAHPHSDCGGRIAIVHNGIIENYAALRRGLIDRGHQFRSETDSEVIAHLIEERAAAMPFGDAVLGALQELSGTFGLGIVSAAEPRVIYAARRGSPLVIGLGSRRDEFFLASDPAAVIAYTRDVMYLDDDEIAVIGEDGVDTMSLERVRREKNVETVQWSLDEIERGNFPHFMLKEIHEQPAVIMNASRGRVVISEGNAVLGGLRDVRDELRTIEKLTIVGCGTAYLAGAVGKLMLEEYADVPTVVELASEFRYRKPIIEPGKEAVIAVSQSGETADTLGALREAKQRGALALGIVNAVGSTIARETDAGVYTHAGPEIAVGSTKAFLAQVTVFSLLTMFLGRQRRMSQAMAVRIAEEMELLPEKIGRILEGTEHIKELAEKYANFPSMFFLGRKYNAAVASEGALKLKELAYVHAEGYPAGEMKHGPIALLDENFPVVGIATKDSVYEKTKSNLEEVKARRAPLIVVTNEGNDELARLADDVIFVPRTIEILSPILNVVPLQLFAYYAAVARGFDPDRPRNLAKSVTVE